jgi:hypothetical protein
MLHAYVERFDVMGTRKNILDWDGEVNKAIPSVASFVTSSTNDVRQEVENCFPEVETYILLL